MDLIKEDSKSILEQWVNQFSDELYSWAFFKTSSKEVAEDLVQDTFMAAFLNLLNFIQWPY
jgi:DNA-directed RNA polymerase specialized sigma24 family protein